MRIQLPRLIVPSVGVPVGQARPLQICPECRYVLSNAGRCENILCSRPEPSSTGGATAPTELKYYSNCSLCPKTCTGHVSR